MAFAKRALPALGAGLGYRSQLHDDIISSAAAIDWLELVTDQFVPPTGVRAGRLQELTERFVCVPHSLELSIGSVADAPSWYVTLVGELVGLIDPPWFSDHLAFSRLPSVNLGAFVPPFRDHESVARIASRVRRLQQATGKTFLLENVASLLEVGGDLDEPTFLSLIAQEADCGILLDLANLHARCLHTGQDTFGFLKRVDLERVVQIHLAGGRYVAGYLRDTHDQPVSEPVWDLLAEVAAQTSINAVLLERDANFPADFDALLAELDRARSILAAPVRPVPAAPPAANAAVQLRARSQADLERLLEDYRRPGQGPDEVVLELFDDAGSKRLTLIELMFPATMAVLAGSGVHRAALAQRFFGGWPRSPAQEAAVGFKPSEMMLFRACAAELAGELGCAELTALAHLEAELALAALSEPAERIEPDCQCGRSGSGPLVLCGDADLTAAARLLRLPFDAFPVRRELLAGTDGDTAALRRLAARFAEPAYLAIAGTGQVIKLGQAEFDVIADPAAHQDEQASSERSWSGRTAMILRLALDQGLVRVTHAGSQ